jgi:hypothetical protein
MSARGQNAMKKRSPLRLATLAIFFCSMYWRPGISQIKVSEERHGAQWTDWIKRYPPSKNAKELELIFSFPDAKLLERDIYLWQPTNVERDRKGNFYVLDTKWRAILKFDPKGAFIKKMGRMGQGPGEFMNPFSMCLTGTRILISDTSRHEISVLDLDLQFVKSLRVPRAYVDIAASENGNIYGVPFRMTNEMELIDVMDDEGKLLLSFGKAMFGDEKRWQLPNFIKIAVNENNEVFAAFQHFAVVCKYRRDGQLASVYNIDNKLMKERERENLRSFANNDRIAWPVINAIHAVGRGFAVMQNAFFTLIMEFDAEGHMSQEYWVMSSDDHKADDFSLSSEGGRVEISLMLTSPENKIEVLRPKR